MISRSHPGGFPAATRHPPARIRRIRANFSVVRADGDAQGSSLSKAGTGSSSHFGPLTRSVVILGLGPRISLSRYWLPLSHLTIARPLSDVRVRPEHDAQRPKNWQNENCWGSGRQLSKMRIVAA
jgi:hypothetical protein